MFPLLLSLFSVVVPLAGVQPTRLVSGPSGEVAPPTFSVREERDHAFTVEFSLPTLQVEDVHFGTEPFQILSIPGGELRGDEGCPALPSVGRLVAVPRGARLQAKVVAKETVTFSGLRLAPMQGEGATAPSMDEAAYTRRWALPEVELGEPGVLHCLWVVPLAINPVSYDPTTGEVTVSSRLVVELSYEGADASPVWLTSGFIPESFHHLFEDLVVNYELVMRATRAQVGPGTYLLVYSSGTGVLDRLTPLVEWRRKQGYTVLVASTAETGTSNTAVKNYIQNVFNTANPPLEFVALAGDADGTYAVPCFTYSGGSTDNPYTLLAGGDNLSDVHLGRLSFSTLTTLEAIVNKILTYETNPPTSDAGWFTRACLTGDPSSSGITTIQINQWLKTQLIRAGYTQIDTIWSGNYVTLMTNSINQGLTVFAYRGYLGMSGFTTTNISGLTNGFELPFAVFPTCGTGNFSGETSRSEAFIRNANGGAIGAIGTATSSTHTRYNNCYFAGTWEGAINGTDHRLGFAHTRGKMNLYVNFQYDGTAALTYSSWNNLMGDPATPMWTAYPTNPTVVYPSSVPVGVPSIPVTVSTATGPVQGAKVTLYKPGELSVTGYTDATGKVDLPVSGATAGTAFLTVTKHNFRPFQGTLSWGTVEVYVAATQTLVDDDASGGSQGNGNGVLNPAETVELRVALRNFGTSSAANVVATLSTLDPFVTILDASESFGTIPAGGTAWCEEDFDFQLSAAAPDTHVVPFRLTVTSGGSSWVSLVELSVQSSAFTANQFTWGGPGGTPDPGESGTFVVRLTNVGSLPATGVTAVLSTTSPWIQITDAQGSYGTIPVGVSVQNTSDPFAFSISPACIRGHKAPFSLQLSFNGTSQATVQFTYGIGTAGSTDPTGPDSYGYYAFDNTDVGYSYAPTYQWVEIDPTYGGPGVAVGLTDNGYEQDDTRVVNLPFPFTFYGQTYTQASICSNGWIAMGQSYLKLYMNQSLPGPGAPEPVICPFWDDLYQSGTNKVYHWFDSANHRYVVQWSRMRNFIDNSPSQTQNFEVILYDPAYYPTPTGDGQIVFQYHTVSNSDSRNGYATVGIQNQDHTDGLLYTYWNAYPSTAAPLTAGRAIRITTVGPTASGTVQGTVTNASNGGTPLAGATVRVLETGQTMLTGSDGQYAGTLTPGTYTLRAEHPSFASQTVPNVAVSQDQTTVVNFSLTDVVGPSITNTTVLPNTANSTGPYVVDATVTDFSSLASVTLMYRVNDGAPVSSAMSLVNSMTGLYRGQIPGQVEGTRVSYWIEARDVANNTGRDPAGSSTYDFYVVIMIFQDDMETNQGWTVGDAGDNATTGIWTRVDPNGVWYGTVLVQPEDDATPDPGVMCFITGNDPPGSTQGTDDVDGGKTTLLSPWFNLSAYTGVHVVYKRWYTNDTGQNPSQDYWVVQVTDGTTWVDLERTVASARAWTPKTFMLDSLIALTPTVRLRFIASDDAAGSVVEAGVDEVAVWALRRVLALSGQLSSGQVVLQWSAVPGADSYWVHGKAEDFYFVPELSNRLVVLPSGTTTWALTNGVGDPSQNWCYVVRAMNASGQEMARSNRVGEFDWTVQRER